MVVFEALVARPGRTHAGCRRLIVPALGPGVDSCYCRIAGAMLELDVARVVVRVTVEVAVNVKPIEIRIRQPAHHSAGRLGDVNVAATDWIFRLAEVQTRIWDWVRLRDIVSIEQMN